MGRPSGTGGGEGRAGAGEPAARHGGRGGGRARGAGEGDRGGGGAQGEPGSAPRRGDHHRLPGRITGGEYRSIGPCASFFPSLD